MNLFNNVHNVPLRTVSFRPRNLRRVEKSLYHTPSCSARRLPTTRSILPSYSARRSLRWRGGPSFSLREESATTRSMDFSLYFRMDCLPCRQDRPAYRQAGFANPHKDL